MNEILIVGAGPTGLALAVALHRHNLPVRIISKAAGPVPATESRAIGIVPRTLEVLHMMGVAEALLRRSHPLRRANMYIGAKPIARLDFDILDTAYPVAILPQGDTEQVLIDYLAANGVLVEREVELMTLQQAQDRVTVQLRHQAGRSETTYARWVVGCDGQHSAVRTAVAAAVQSKPYEEIFILADVHLESPFPRDESYAFLHPSGVFNMFPMPHQLVRIVAVLNETWRSRIPGKPTLADFQAIVDERGPGGIRLLDATWISRFTISRQIATRFRYNRVFLAGDAAHVHSPAGGQGMNTGIQDAHNLAWKLALVVQGRAPETLLDSYHDERYPVAQAVIRLTDRNTRLGVPRNPIIKNLMNLLLAGLLAVKPIARRLSSDFAELNVRYSPSAIIVDKQRRTFRVKGVPAGHRAVDVPLSLKDNTQTVRLYDLLQQSTHLLLLCGGATPTPDTDARIASLVALVTTRYADRVIPYVVTSTEPLTRLYGEAPWSYGIRPDGYVGFRGTLDAESLDTYLRTVFLPLG